MGRLIGSLAAAGGATRTAKQIAEGLNRDRFTTMVFAQEGGPLLDELERAGVHVQIVPKFGGTARMIVGMARMFMAADLDILHIHGLEQRKARLAALLSKMARRKPAIVLTHHGTGEFTKRRHLLMDKATMPWVDAITGVSSIAMDHCRRHFHVDFMRLILNGIDSSQFRRADMLRLIMDGGDTNPVESILGRTDKLRELGIGEDTRVVAFVGRLVEQKGCRFFITAAEMVLRDHDDVRFLVVGDGELRAELQAMAKARVGENMVFCGPRTDVPEIMPLVDVLVVPSLWEALGRVVLEAMAAGCPVVASGVDGILEVVRDGENGLLVPVGNPTALGEAVHRILSDRELAGRLAVAGRKTVDQAFTAERMVRQYEELYESLLSHKQGACTVERGGLVG